MDEVRCAGLPGTEFHVLPLHQLGRAPSSSSLGPLEVTISFGSPVRVISWVPVLEGLILALITLEVHRLFLQQTFGGHQAVLSSRLNKSQPVSKYDFRVTICSGCSLKLTSHFRAKWGSNILQRAGLCTAEQEDL